MTHDKVRQDFEAWLTKESLLGGYELHYFRKDECGDYEMREVQNCYDSYQAGRAAERAEIREKLESEGVVETIATALINGLRFHKGCTTAVTGTHAMLDDDAESYKAEAEAAIIKILEVI